jgi:hypothetical protein
VLDRAHRNGDPAWDGDQTLHEITVADEERTAKVLVVVPRGDAFIPGDKVARHVETLGLTLPELEARARVPGPGRRPQVALPIEPGEALEL